jgi:dihydrodipicolinate synthase/N-acetylneuraminate lyase
MTATVTGVLAAIATPFDRRTGAVAEDRLRANVAALLADGLSGVVVAGSTGEAPLLDADEVRRLVGVARDAVPSGRRLLAGTGAEATRQAVALSRAAGAEGADAVLVRPPAYFGPGLGATQLADYYRGVADGSPVPVLVYNIPKFTRVAIPAAVLVELAAHPNIAGVKDSSGDIDTFTSYRAAVPGWSVLVGSASLLLAALERGGDGSICAAACFAARRCADLYAAFRAGDRGRAAALQEQITPLDRRIVGGLGAAGVKAAMDAAGLYGGPVRAPLADLPAAESSEVAVLVRG